MSEYPRILGMLTLYCADRELARDLTQETMIRTVQHWKKVRAMEAPSAWTHRVAINLAHSWFRRAVVRTRAVIRLGAQTTEAHRDPDPGDAVSVREALAALSPRQKAAVVLRYYSDLPVDEVAEIMGCKSGTVWALSSQALATLRRAGLSDTDVDDG